MSDAGHAAHAAAPAKAMDLRPGSWYTSWMTQGSNGDDSKSHAHPGAPVRPGTGSIQVAGLTGPTAAQGTSQAHEGVPPGPGPAEQQAEKVTRSLRDGRRDGAAAAAFLGHWHLIVTCSRCGHQDEVAMRPAISVCGGGGDSPDGSGPGPRSPPAGPIVVSPATPPPSHSPGARVRQDKSPWQQPLSPASLRSFQRALFSRLRNKRAATGGVGGDPGGATGGGRRRGRPVSRLMANTGSHSAASGGPWPGGSQRSSGGGGGGGGGDRGRSQSSGSDGDSEQDWRASGAVATGAAAAAAAEVAAKQRQWYEGAVAAASAAAAGEEDVRPAPGTVRPGESPTAPWPTRPAPLLRRHGEFDLFRDTAMPHGDNHSADACQVWA